MAALGYFFLHLSLVNLSTRHQMPLDAFFGVSARQPEARSEFGLKTEVTTKKGEIG
jgi:hypothetical protein